MSHDPDRRRAVYLAAPLFSQAERRWNRRLADRLRTLLPCTVILPQEFAAGAPLGSPEHYAAIFRQCLEGVYQADLLVAVLDGPDADSGTAFEMGVAHALGKPIIGVRTDFRNHQEHGTNIMLARACAAIVRCPAPDDDLEALADAVARQTRPLLVPDRPE